MGLKIGLVGKPNVGKSTLFAAATLADAAIGNYPFTTIQANVGVAGKRTNANKYGQGGFIGDYTGLAASDRAVHGVWTDGRNLDNDVYTSAVDLDFSTNVESISAAAGGTANFTIDVGPLYQNDAYRVLGSISGTSPGLVLHHVDVDTG